MKMAGECCCGNVSVLCCAGQWLLPSTPPIKQAMLAVLSKPPSGVHSHGHAHIQGACALATRQASMQGASEAPVTWVSRQRRSRLLSRDAPPTRRANIKVSSTETGAIFGNIVYESTGYAERSVVVLSDIHIDIMDYISPASCPDVQFRSMWAEFEWENKVRGHCKGQCGILCLPHMARGRAARI